MDVNTNAVRVMQYEECSTINAIQMQYHQWLSFLSVCVKKYMLLMESAGFIHPCIISAGM